MASRFESDFMGKSYDVNCTSDIQGKSLSNRSRTRNPELWLKSRRKKAILSGQSYTNTRGKVVSSKRIGPNCNCRNKCFHEVNEESRKKIFNGFYNLKSYDEQNSYLYGLIRRHAVLRKRHLNSVKRACSYKYYVRIQGREVQVCKRAFASIHSISDKKIRTLCLKHEQSVMFPRDNRGRHCNRPKKVSSAVVRLVKQHIVEVLSGTTASDFMKADKHQMPHVNVTKLYRNFLSQHESQALLPDSDKLNKDYDAKVKPWVYFKVFHEEFKSLDLQTIKRRLADLRRSLSANSITDDAKLPSPCSTSAGVTPVINVPTLHRQNTSSHSQQNITLVNTYTGVPTTTCDLPSPSTSAGSRQQHQIFYQQQLQPLNLQMLSTATGVSGVSSSSTAFSSCSSSAILTSSSGVAFTLPTNGHPYLFSLGPNLIPTATLSPSPTQFYATSVVPPCAIFTAAPSPIAGVSPKQNLLPPSNGSFVNVASSLNANTSPIADRFSNNTALCQSEKLVATTVSHKVVPAPLSARSSSRILATPLHIATQQNTSILHAAAPLYNAATVAHRIPGSLNTTTTSLKILTPLNVTALQEDTPSRDYNSHRVNSSGNVASAFLDTAHHSVGCHSEDVAVSLSSQIHRSVAASQTTHAPLNIMTLQSVHMPHSVHISPSIPLPHNFNTLTTVSGVKAV
ncbi:hypothetical protein FHG87_017137 [Trinorchestia longiramus]|nr:hypothetical protein FHG87_017137 [Trinorchestia longiramus]